MLSISGRADALACRTSQSTHSCKQPAVFLKPVLARKPAFALKAAFGKPSIQRPLGLIKCVLLVKALRNVYLPRGNRKRQRHTSVCSTSSQAVDERQVVFRHATSTEDLQQASEHRADAYYAVQIWCILPWHIANIPCC